MDAKLNTGRAIPRWVHWWAVATVVVTLGLLILGQLVTSFRAGMADPIWPTEPWYLFFHYKLDFGYIIEHSHRKAGYVIGTVVSLLVLGVWWTDPRRTARWTGLLSLVVLLGAFGWFQAEVMRQSDPNWVVLPVAPVLVLAVALGTVLVIGLVGAARSVPWSELRTFAVIVLVAIMAQGVLGGLRVRLNALKGPELAIVHGIFAQVVFCLLVSLAVVTSRPATTELPEGSRRLLNRLSLGLVAILFVQLIWGALVRHTPNALNQRLHLLTAFLAVALAVWLIRAIATNPAARARAGFTAWLLAALIAVQVTLGVEAWMGKFGEEARGGRAASSYLAEAADVNVKQAAMRTAHTLVGTGVLAAAVVIALRIRAKPAPHGETANEQDLWDRAIAPEPALALSGKRP
jgi:heme A synthase